jgi:hypothetical protein
MPAITETVRRFIYSFRRPVRCSACDLPRGAGRRLISGPGVYICEGCVAEVARRETRIAADRCSFCHRRENPIAGAWPNVTICYRCAELARSILDDPNP